MMATGAGHATFDRATLHGSIVDRFVEQAARHRSRPALLAEEASLTYGELAAAAFGLATEIVGRLGDRPEPVLLLLPQGPAAIVAVLGALAAGKCYVPVDPGDPAGHLSRVADEVEPRLVLTDPSHAGPARRLSRGAVLVVDDPGRWSAPRPPLSALNRTRPAYVYFTSGATGPPKGVVDTHENVLHNVMRYTTTLGLGPDDRMSLIQSPSFSGVVSTTFGALLNGAALCPIDVRRHGMRRVARLLERERATVFHAVPVLFRALAAARGDLSALRLVRLEGDRATGHDQDLFRTILPRGAVLVNGLGATECGLVRQFFLDHDSPRHQGVLPVGYPVIDMEVDVLRETGARAAPGELGEIVVRSRYLASGYWRRPDLTARRFGEGGPGLPRGYRTGDLGRLDPDGCLEVHGRLDGRCKVGGILVEPAAMETLLVGHAAVGEAVVGPVERPGGATGLMAYVVPSHGTSPDASALRRHLAHHYPSACLPGIEFCDELPTTPCGKLDRAGLGAEGVQSSPGTAVEAALVAIWRRVLDAPRVGLDDAWFDLGGDSLRALELCLEIEHHLGRAVSPSLVARAATVRGLAASLEGVDPGGASTLVPLRAAGTRPPLFCVPGAAEPAIALAPLARHLPGDQPVYAFEPRGLDGRAEPDASVPAMATRYLAELRALQPHGPYLLAGSCFGAAVALEMAHRLMDAGEPIGLLALLGDPGTAEPIGRRAHPVRRALSAWRRSTLADLVDTAARELRTRLNPRRRAVRRVLDAHLLARARHRPRGLAPGTLFSIGLTTRLPARPGPEPTAVRSRVERVGVPAERWRQEPWVIEVAAALERHLRPAGPAPAGTGPPALSLVLPCYNEGGHLESSVNRVLDVLRRSGLVYEVFLIDDDSRDGTARRLWALAAAGADPSVRCAFHHENRGRGATVAEGIRRARGVVVAYLDVDLEVSPAYLPGATRLILEDRADVVVGDRRLVWTPRSAVHNALSRASRRLARVALGTPDLDTQAGFKLFRRSAILPVLDRVRDPRWFWDTEITVRCLDEGLRVASMPVGQVRRHDKRSTVRLFRDSARSLMALARFARQRRGERR